MKCYKLSHFGTEMRRTGERIGMMEFYVCLKCHPERTKQVEEYEAFEKKLWENHEQRKKEAMAAIERIEAKINAKAKE